MEGRPDYLVPESDTFSIVADRAAHFREHRSSLKSQTRLIYKIHCANEFDKYFLSVWFYFPSYFEIQSGLLNFVFQSAFMDHQ